MKKNVLQMKIINQINLIIYKKYNKKNNKIIFKNKII